MRLRAHCAGEAESLKEIIRKRKSVRKYEQAPLDGAVLEKITAQLANLKPLDPSIKYEIEIVTKTKGMFNIKAPHYLVFRSEEKEGACENIGFIGQQMDLFLSENELGTCWLGVSKPDEKKSASGLSCLICMSFGLPDEPVYRSYQQFKRKELGAISQGSDPRLEAARLAPSGMNAQNWYFIADQGSIHCYRKKVNPLLGFWLNDLARIDLGIAICHIAEESEDFKFAVQADAPKKNGYVYFGTAR